MDRGLKFDLVATRALRLRRRGTCSIDVGFGKQHDRGMSERPRNLLVATRYISLPVTQLLFRLCSVKVRTIKREAETR